MNSKFYNKIIERERNVFNIEDKSLKTAGQAVVICHNKQALEKGSTYLDYNLPQNRCAYVYRYASLHTKLALKFFRALLKKKSVKQALISKKSIEICSLGGGPGIDVIGMFQSMAYNSRFHGKISRVSILDRCSGWETTFSNMIEGVFHGELKAIPSTFINYSDFKGEVVTVDLLQVLSHEVKEKISNADIICMVGFVSVVLKKKGFTNALKTIGHLLKCGAVVLFIDNHHGSVLESIEEILKETGLEIVLGPVHEKAECVIQSQKDVYSCEPQFGKKFSIAGWIKTSQTLDNLYTAEENCSAISCNNDSGTDMDSEWEDVNYTMIGSTSKVDGDDSYARIVESSFGSRNMENKQEAINNISVENDYSKSLSCKSNNESKGDADSNYQNINTAEVQFNPALEIALKASNNPNDVTSIDSKSAKEMFTSTEVQQSSNNYFNGSNKLVSVNINRQFEREDSKTKAQCYAEIDNKINNSNFTIRHSFSDKYTQTEADDFLNISNDEPLPTELGQLLHLTGILTDLVNEIISKQHICNRCCCCSCVHYY